jgi:hypothetical protein
MAATAATDVSKFLSFIECSRLLILVSFTDGRKAEELWLNLVFEHKVKKSDASD